MIQILWKPLIYQKLLLSDNIENKLELLFLLKDLFEKDKLSSVYSEEFLYILKNIDQNKIPDNYSELVEQNLKENSFPKNDERSYQMNPKEFEDSQITENKSLLV